MADYQISSQRFVNIGLNLRDSPDKVSEGEWTRLHNVRSTQEGQVQPREGLDLFVSTGSGSLVHSIARLGDTALLVGTGTQLFRNGVAYPTNTYSGKPLGIVPYRPTVSSVSWAYVGDSSVMRKVNASGTDYGWGIVAPTVGAVFVTNGAGNLNSSVAGASVYDWRYTYYSSLTGAESNPSVVVGGIAAVNQQVAITVNASLDPQVTQIRIYRRGGTIPNSWNLSFTVSNLTGSYIDNNADSLIVTGNVLHLDRFVPFTSIDASGNTVFGVPLPYVWGPFVGKYIMACGAPNQPGYVFWTNPQLPDESSTLNTVEVTPPHEPLQNGFIYGSNPYVFSRNELYALDFGNPNAVTFVPRKTAVGRGLAAPWAFCVGPYVWFLSNDGIYQTDCFSPAQNITETDLRPLFRGIAASNLNPIDYTQTTALRMAFSGQEVWLFYKDTLGNYKALVFNILYNRWRSGDATAFNQTIGFNDKNVAQTRFLIGADNGNVYNLDSTTNVDVGSTYNVNCRTGSMDQGSPGTLKEYGNIVIDADPQGNLITVTPYVNTEQTALNSFVISGTGRQKFTSGLQDTKAYNIAFDFSWSQNQPTFGGILYQEDLQWRIEEKAIRHWNLITTHGILGWQHVRDAYFSVISNAAITLTLTIDNSLNGGPYTYTIPSTGGVRLKQYIPLKPTKGKIFQYTLDSPNNDFRLFGNECEVRVKQWNPIGSYPGFPSGYQLIYPFRGRVEV